MLSYIFKALNAYKRNVLPIVGAQLLLLLIVFVLIGIAAVPIYFKVYEIVIQQGTLDTNEIASTLLQSTELIVFALILGTLALLVAISLSVGLVKVYADALAGKARARTMFSTAREKWLTAVGATLAELFVIVTVLITIAIIMLVIGASAYSMSVMPAAILIASIFFVYVNQSVALSNLKALQAVQNSISFAKKNFISTLGLMAVFVAISVVLSYISNYINVSFISLIISLASIFFIGPVAVLSYTALYLSMSGRKPNKPAARRRTKRR